MGRRYRVNRDCRKLSRPRYKSKLRRNWRDFAALKQREIASLRVLEEVLPQGAAMLVVPDLCRQPRTLQDLAEIAGMIDIADLRTAD